MSHEIETMAYTGETPWHGLGTFVGDKPVDSAAMLQLAGLDWEVKTTPLFTATAPRDDGGKLIAVPGHNTVMRCTDNAILGVVGDRYHPLQNTEAFEVLDSLVSDGSMRYHTAGSLRDGQRIWALGKLDRVEIVPGHNVDNYVLIYTGHDGATSTRVLWTQVEVVCANTARAALSAGKGEGLSVRHSANQKTRLSTASRVLGIAQENLEKSCEFLKSAAHTRLTEERWVHLTRELIPDPEKGSPVKAQNKREELTRLLFRGRGKDVPGIEGTLYAARGAVTEWCNYHRATRGKNAQEKRLDASLFGSSATMIAKCDNILAEMLNDPDFHIEEPQQAVEDAVSMLAELQS